MRVVELLAGRVQAGQVLALLQAASPFVQQVARLRAEGFTFRKVADLLSGPMSAIMSRWFAWCRSVRKTLKQEKRRPVRCGCSR